MQFSVPTDEEWTELIDYLGGASLASTKLRETGAIHWPEPNTATNESGFTALPGGARFASFHLMGERGYWLSSSTTVPYNVCRSCYAWGREISSTSVEGYAMNENNGVSIRCLKGEVSSVPTVTTSEVSNISLNTAEVGGSVTDDGGESVSERGILWSADPDLRILDNRDNKIVDVGGSGSFSSTLSGLGPNATYYIRAYAINSIGIGYGEEISFQTLWDPNE